MYNLFSCPKIDSISHDTPFVEKRSFTTSSYLSVIALEMHCTQVSDHWFLWSIFWRISYLVFHWFFLVVCVSFRLIGSSNTDLLCSMDMVATCHTSMSHFPSYLYNSVTKGAFHHLFVKHSHFWQWLQRDTMTKRCQQWREIAQPTAAKYKDGYSTNGGSKPKKVNGGKR